MSCEGVGDGYVLGIECSNPSAMVNGRGEVALGKREGDGFAWVETRELGETVRGTDGLMLTIDGLCRGCGVEAGALSRVAVSVGPGGYTALRVSVTVAKMLGEVLGVEVVGVETARVASVELARGLGGEFDGEAMIVLAAKGRGEKASAHCSVYRGGAYGAVEVIGVVDGDGFEDLGFRGVLVGDEHLPQVFREKGEAVGCGVRGLVLSGRGVLEASLGMEGVDVGGLSVVYAREPDAVTQWRARHGGGG